MLDEPEVQLINISLSRATGSCCRVLAAYVGARHYWIEFCGGGGGISKYSGCVTLKFSSSPHEPLKCSYDSPHPPLLAVYFLKFPPLYFVSNDWPPPFPTGNNVTSPPIKKEKMPEVIILLSTFSAYVNERKRFFITCGHQLSMRFVWVGDGFLIANACTMFLDDTGKFHLQVFNIIANNFLLC